MFSENIEKVQDFLGRKIFIENPSAYFEYNNSSYREPEFLNLLSENTGCGILLDINNIYVSSQNNGWSAIEYLNSINPKYVKEIHLAGHSEYITENGKKLLIDTHDNNVCNQVWDLYNEALSIFGQVPTLIEWDQKIPKLETLIFEAKKATLYMQEINNIVYV